MAHYVAELMEVAQTAPPKSRNAAEDRCAAAILALWDHRTGLSNRRVPMELGSIVEVLQRLDPAKSQPVYFLASWREMSREATSGNMGRTSERWLRVAEQVDQAARLMIVSALGKAAETEADRAKHWVKLAEAAGADDGPDVQLIRRLIVLTTHERGDHAAEIEELEDRLTKLADLRRAAHAIESEWRAALANLRPEDAAISSATDDAAD